MSEEEYEEEITDLSDSNVVTKYKEAAGIATKTLNGLIGYCKPGTKIVSACALGDTLIRKQCENIFKSKKIEKGIAFPTCLSVNEIVCHFSPLESESKELVLQDGDLVKIDLGVFIDGYIVVAAKTFICSEDNTSPTPIEGQKAACFKAAYTALEGCNKLMKPGAKNTDLTKFIQKVGECYGVTPVQGVLMHQLKRFVIDGNEVILNKEDPEQKVDEFEFEVNKVYTIDIVYSTGTGKPQQTTHRTTVFKRAIDQNYQLKMKASRQLFAKISKDCGILPFCLRGLLGDEKTERLGIVECIKHGLVHDYPVLVEKEGSTVVHLKASVMVMNSGSTRITVNDNLSSIQEWCKCDKEPTEEIKEVLSRSTKNKKKKKKPPTK